MSASFGPSAVRVTPKQFTRVVPRPTSLCHQFERAAPRLWCWCDCHPERSEGSAIGSTADSSSPAAPQNDSAGEPGDTCEIRTPPEFLGARKLTSAFYRE